MTCPLGYSGTPLRDCSADPCIATNISIDDGPDGNFYCINGGATGGTTGSCTCTCTNGYAGAHCQNPHNVDTMTSLYNKVGENGNAIMANGDTIILAEKIYRCNTGSCESDKMLDLEGLSGSMECASDTAGCTLDTQSSREVMRVLGTGGQKLTLRALTFKDGKDGWGGGIDIRNSAIVDIIFCVFSRCQATSSPSSDGEGAIYLSSGSVNVHATQFTANVADNGYGDDIYKGSGTITIHNTYPSPYSSNTPTRGSALDTHGTVGGSKYSYSGCVTCLAPTDASKDGSDNYIYCINGGTAGGTSGSCTCIFCNSGFNGSNCAACVVGYSGSDCTTADPCIATSISTDGGSDGKFYCINGGAAGGTTGSCTCTSCDMPYNGPNCENPHDIYDMTGLWDTISNGAVTGDQNQNVGNNIMANDDTASLSVGAYKCSEGTCASTNILFRTLDLYGSIECIKDSADCVLDGESTRRVILVGGTAGHILIVRAITFKSGYRNRGGGLWVDSGASVEILLSLFTDCHSNSAINYGGGAIWVEQSSDIAVTLYASRFTGNSAASGYGNDILNHNSKGSVTIHDTCPSPYSSNTPTQGLGLGTYGSISGSPYTYFCYHVCPAGQYNPTLGNLISSCETCTEVRPVRRAQRRASTLSIF